jgi:hypothetical protein
MTAFEILLNRFYEIIEENEPKANHNSRQKSSSELNMLIREFVNTSYKNGQNLSYKNQLSRLISQAGYLLKNSSYDEWLQIKYIFQQNDLHILKRGRNKEAILHLKSNLEKIF